MTWKQRVSIYLCKCLCDFELKAEDKILCIVHTSASCEMKKKEQEKKEE